MRSLPGCRKQDLKPEFLPTGFPVHTWLHAYGLTGCWIFTRKRLLPVYKLLDPTAASSHRSPCVALGEEQRVPEGLTAKQRARRGRSRERGAERGGLVAKINRKMVKYSTARTAPILRRRDGETQRGKSPETPAPPAARP